jgi:hypothetical protein
MRISCGSRHRAGLGPRWSPKDCRCGRW